MNTLLISRERAISYRKIFGSTSSVCIPVAVNHPLEAVFYLGKYPEQIKMVVLVEPDNAFTEIEEYLNWVPQIIQDEGVLQFLVITRNERLQKALSHEKYAKVGIHFVEDIKISPQLILNKISEWVSKLEKEQNEKKTFFKKSILKKEDLRETHGQKCMEDIRQRLLKYPFICAVTGHTGMGATSTAANLAYLASRMGIQTVLLDFDMQGKNLNLHFPKFGEEVEAGRELERSLIKVLQKPEAVFNESCRVNDYLWVSSLAYSFAWSPQYEKAFTEERLALTFHVLKEKAHFIVLDVSIKQDDRFMNHIEKLAKHVDAFVFCIQNSLYSLANAAKSLQEPYLKDPLFQRKLRLMVSKFMYDNTYNGKPFSSNIVLDLFHQMLAYREDAIPFLGYLPFLNDFEFLLDTNKKAVLQNKTYKSEMIDIMKHLIL